MKTGLLSEARHAVLPKGIVTSGFPAVEATCRQLGMVFDPWQADLNRCILAKSKTGLYAADTVVISIPRQVGKTWDIGALVFALCIINPGITVVWTAHRFKVARETFNSLKAVALSAALSPHIDPDDIYTAAGNESITFRNGSRIVFAARERGAVRGFTEVEVLVLDEGQILSENAMSDLAPTTNQAKNPLIILMGTPPRPVDPGEVFTRLRTDALAGDSDDVLYVEFSAPLGSEPDDRAAWKIANPSHPKRTSARAIQRLRKLLTVDDFMREAMGIWDDLRGAAVFGLGAWEDCHGDPPNGLTMSALAVAVSVDLTHSAIVATASDGELIHVKPLQHGLGTGWVVDRAKSLQDEHGAPVVIDGRGPGAVLIPHLERAGVRLRVATTSDVLDSCAGIYDLVREKRLRHARYPELEAAVAGAVKRNVGDRWAWGRKVSSADISTLEAATLAAWATGDPVVAKSSVYEARGMVTL